MADSKISVQTEKPGIVSAESFDVFSGKNGLDRAAYKAASFHATGDTSGDARFQKAADLMGATGAELNAVEPAGEDASEKKTENKGY